jgi:hypothetical protein
MRKRIQLGVVFLGGSLLFGEANSSPTVVTGTGCFGNNGHDLQWPVGAGERHGDSVVRGCRHRWADQCRTAVGGGYVRQCQRGSGDGGRNQPGIPVGLDDRFSGNLPHRRSFRSEPAQRRGAVHEYRVEGYASVDGPGAGIAELLDGNHGVGLRQTGPGGRSDRNLSHRLGEGHTEWRSERKVLPTGSLAPTDGSVLYKTIEPPNVTIGGAAATVSFSGIAPGNAGQYQINVQVPNGVTTGD